MSNLTNLFKQVLGILDFFGHNILVPILFAIALIPFIYGLVNYLVLGPGDEEKKEQGRGQLFKANVYLIIATLVWAVFWSFSWLGENFSLPSLNPSPEIEGKEKIQPIPNTPLR